MDINLPSVDSTSRSHIHLSPERMREEKITTKQSLRRKAVQSSTVHITPQVNGLRTPFATLPCLALKSLRSLGLYPDMSRARTS